MRNEEQIKKILSDMFITHPDSNWDYKRGDKKRVLSTEDKHLNQGVARQGYISGWKGETKTTSFRKTYPKEKKKK